MTDKYDDGHGKPGQDPLIPLNLQQKAPKQVAVAIAGPQGNSTIPSVTAAGRGKVAEQILQLAFDAGIKVRQDSALAEMLAALELDSPVPNEALIAVAEILSYVYRANGQPDPFNAALDEVADPGE